MEIFTFFGLLAIFGIGGAFKIYKLDMHEAEVKKHEVLRKIVIGDITKALQGTPVDLKSHLSQYCQDYEITPELIQYCVDNYQSVFIQELENRGKHHKNDPVFKTPIKEQLSLESMTGKIESIRFKQKQESID